MQPKVESFEFLNGRLRLSFLVHSTEQAVEILQRITNAGIATATSSDLPTILVHATRGLTEHDNVPMGTGGRPPIGAYVPPTIADGESAVSQITRGHAVVSTNGEVRAIASAEFGVPSTPIDPPTREVLEPSPPIEAPTDTTESVPLSTLGDASAAEAPARPGTRTRGRPRKAATVAALPSIGGSSVPLPSVPATPPASTVPTVPTAPPMAHESASDDIPFGTEEISDIERQLLVELGPNPALTEVVKKVCAVNKEAGEFPSAGDISGWVIRHQKLLASARNKDVGKITESVRNILEVYHLGEHDPEKPKAA